MKKSNPSPCYKPLGSAVVRLPNLTLENAYESLQNMNIDDFCKEAILYASPNLYDELNKYLNGEIASDKDKERMKATLTKYITLAVKQITN